MLLLKCLQGQRNALGNDLLGKSYTELLPLLNAGAGMVWTSLRTELMNLDW